MILVVVAFVVLTAAAMLNAYGPCLGHERVGKAFGCFLGLLVFFSLVRISLEALTRSSLQGDNLHAPSHFSSILLLS